MKLRLVTPVIVFTLLAAGCSSDDDAAEVRTPVATGITESAAAPNAPDVIGQNLKDARAALEAAGFAIVATDSLEDRAIIVESNWIVTDQTTDGETVNLGVQKATDGQESANPSEGAAGGPADPAAPPSNATPSGLTSGTASVACDQVGEADYPYGFDASWLLNGTQLIEGDTILLKAGVEIENAFGNRAEATVECRVSGTEAAPVVDEFHVYQ